MDDHSALNGEHDALPPALDMNHAPHLPPPSLPPLPPPPPPPPPHSQPPSQPPSPHKPDGHDGHDGHESDHPTQNKISCIECRRLKRKCDRIHPCEQCRRYGKTCVFPEPEQPRRGKRYIAEMENRVERLERLLNEHAPHVRLDDEMDMGDGDSPSSAGGASGNPLKRPRSPPASVRTYPPRAPSPPVHRGPAPFYGPDRSSPNTRMAGGPGSGSLSAGPSPSSLFERPGISPAGLGGTPTAGGRVFDTVGAADAYERQPRNASGYEWDERRRGATCENDGTASLSIEPDGEGYLGFASGATLLRILQMTAGGVSLAHIPKHAMPAATAPEGWRPSHSGASRYIDAYFAYYHTQYPIIHESTFRAQFAEVIPQPPRPQWLLLVNTVVGLGAFCSSEAMHVVDHYLERAISVITADHLETGSLTLVQAYTLLSNLAQKRNKPNAGSTYLGIAVRMAIGLGLHRELPLWNIKPFEREVRRRAWWVVYIFDAGASVTFGRPILLPYGSADVKMVHNVQDRDFTPSAPAVPPASSDTTIYTSLMYQAGFHLVGNRCYERVISTPPPSADEVLELDCVLRDWHSELPVWMKVPTAPRHDYFRDTPWLHFSAHKLFWRYCNLRIILMRRAFLERALGSLPLSLSAVSPAPGSATAAGGGVSGSGVGGGSGSAPGTTPSDGVPPVSEPQPALEHTLASLCLESALDTIADIHAFFGRCDVLGALEKWYGLHFLFQATFVPLIALHTDAGSIDRPAWVESVRRARETLCLPTVSGDALAARCLSIIDLLTPADPPALPAGALESGAPNGALGTHLTGGPAAPGAVPGQPNTDMNALLQSLQASALWAGEDLTHSLLPFADLETLMSLWPAGSQ